MTELASEVVSVDTPKVQDITQPKKLARKGLGIIELGLGGIAERNLIAPLLNKIPLPASELGDLLELIIFGLANGVTDNNDINNVVSGAIVGSMTRLSEKIIERIKSLIGMNKFKMSATAAATAPAPSSGLEDFF
jgi:hypothetical protein